jgi:rSAM/selenodomain-associated transferase 2
MPAPITVIIPTLNAAQSLAGIASALMPGIEAGLIRALIVSDGGSGDATIDVAEELGATLVAGPPGRAGQIARGVAVAASDWLLILHADSWPQTGWTSAAARHIETHPDDAGWFGLRFRAKGIAPRLVAGWANQRSARFGLPYGDQGLLIRADLLATVGGVPELPLMEDVALARALRGRMRPLDADVSTSADRYLATGWLRRGARNLWTLALYLAGVDPAKLAAGYRRD